MGFVLSKKFRKKKFLSSKVSGINYFLVQLTVNSVINKPSLIADFNSNDRIIFASSRYFEPVVFAINNRSNDVSGLVFSSIKKRSKSTARSNSDLVYVQHTGDMFYNKNGSSNGWGKKHGGGLVANFSNQPQLSIDNFMGLLSNFDSEIFTSKINIAS